MKIIIGLGNPGKEYARTRHNIGFATIDYLLLNINSFGNWKHDKKSNAEIAKGEIAGQKVILAKPQTFMNNSGSAVKKLTTDYGLRTTDLLIVHDDLDLPLGTLRLSRGSGSAGHKGVQSIIDALGTKDFWRLRIGVGSKKGDAAKFVLKPFSRIEQMKVKKIIGGVIHLIEIMFEKYPDAAQAEINKAGQ